MGLYQDIQNDVSEAMAGDLLDAVASLVVTESVSSTAYNPVGGTVSNTPVQYTMDCIVMDDDEEKKDEEDYSTDYVKLLILDSKRTIPEFKVGMKATVRESDYTIGKVTIDPVGATYVLKCRKT